MRVIYQIPNDDPRKSQEAARAAEDAGFDGVAALENPHGPIPTLTAAALATERVQLGTAVMIAFPRSPTVTAHAAWDLGTGFEVAAFPGARTLGRNGRANPG